MKIAIFGAGAVGGHVAVRLAQAGHDVSVVARGPALEAIRSRGLQLLVGDERYQAAVAASDDPADLGPQDLVISTLKSTGLSALARGAGPLLGPETPVLFAQNGIPWWYAYGAGAGPQPDLGWLDPGHELRSLIGLTRTLGGVIFSSNEVVEPGVVRNDSPEYNALFVGEPDGAATARVANVREVLTAAGVQSPDADDLRAVLWRKLIGNMTISVLCMVTGQTARAAVEDPLFAALAPTLMQEAAAIAAAQGYPPPPRTPGTRAPDHVPSLRQDFALGRPVELDALLVAPLAFARTAGLQTPALDALGAIAQRLATDKGLYARPSAASPAVAP